MKKPVSVMCIIFSMLLMLTSCNNKDQSPSIVGKWQVLAVDVTTYLDGSVYDSYTETAPVEYTMEFTSNGSFFTMVDLGTEQVSYNGSYIVSGNKVTVSYKDGSTVQSSTLTIESISQSSLILINEDYVISDGKVYQHVARMILKRV